MYREKRYKLIKSGLVLICLTLSLGLLMSCAQNSQGYDAYPVSEDREMAGDYKVEYAEDKSVEKAELPGQGEGLKLEPITAQEITDGKKIIYNYQLDLEILPGSEFQEKCKPIVKKYQAYLVDADVYTIGDDSRSSQKLYRYNYVWRVKPELADDFVQELKALATVTRQNVSRQDMTREYYDTAAHLDNKKLEEKSLQELLTQAEKVEDVLAIQSALSDLRYEIDRLEGNLRYIDRNVDESTVELNVQEVANSRSQAYIEGQSFTDRIQDYLLISYDGLKQGGEAILYFLIVFGPWLILALIVVLICSALISKRSARRRRIKQAERIAEQEKIAEIYARANYRPKSEPASAQEPVLSFSEQAEAKPEPASVEPDQAAVEETKTEK